MVRSLLLCFAILSCSLAFGQRYENHPAMKTRSDGALVPASATIAICTQPATTGTTPCSPLATLYSDSSLTTACNGTSKDGSSSGAGNCSNPLVTDSKGNYHFYAQPSAYTIQIYGSGLTTTSEPDVIVPVNSAATRQVNQIYFASQYCNGSTDLGVCITNANNSGNPNGTTPIWVIADASVTSSISTSPTLSRGTKFTLMPASYSLSTTWVVNHHGIDMDFSGTMLNYNLDAGNAAMIIGKNLSGNLTCNGTTTVSWNSGSQFTAFDLGDQVFINVGGGSAFNVASVTNATTMLVTAACPAAANVSYAGYMLPATALGSWDNSPFIRNLIINYTGANTLNNIGLQLDFVMDTIVENVLLENFSRGTCLKLLGSQTSLLNNVKTHVCKNGAVLDAKTGGGVQVQSNNNQFNSFQAQNSCTLDPAGNAILIQGASFGNFFPGLDIEGGVCTDVIKITGGSYANIIGPSGDIERNGDGSANATDVHILSGPDNIVEKIRFSSSFANVPNTGIKCDAGDCVIRDNMWQAGAPYATAYTFINGATGFTERNTTNGIGFINPNNYIADAAGNAAISNNLALGSLLLMGAATGTGAAAGDAVLKNSGCLRAATSANNATFCIVSGSNDANSNAVVDPSNQNVKIGTTGAEIATFAGIIKLGTQNTVINGSTQPTIAGAGCGGSGATIPNSNGTAAFTINVGTAPTAGGCTVTMPAAATGWTCSVVDVTTNSTAIFLQKQFPAASQSATQILLQNFNDVAVAAAPTANDIWRVQCLGY
jgi:hypothetical protein